MKTSIRLVTILASSVILAGCAGTVTPPHVAPTVATFDGSEQNSGLICFTNGFALITPHAADRYAKLMSLYGKAWVPPVQPGDGLTLSGTNYLLDKQHLTYFIQSNLWRKNNRPPVTNYLETPNGSSAR